MTPRLPVRGLCLLAALSLAVSWAACAPPPHEEVGPTATIQFKTGVMHDRLLFTFIQVFQVHILEAVNSTGAAVSCSDFPSRYRTTPVDPRLREATKASNVANKWNNPPTAATLNKITVPSDTKLLVLVKGLAQTQKGPQVIGRGCVDDLKYKDGSENTLVVDVKASTGAPCLQQNECELTLTCNSGPKLPGGYCAKVSCAGDATCPPGSRCVSDTEGGTTMCMRACKQSGDCDLGYPQSQVCEGRQGPTTGGCADVCVHPFWNKKSVCTSTGS